MKSLCYTQRSNRSFQSETDVSAVGAAGDAAASSNVFWGEDLPKKSPNIFLGGD